LIARSVIIAEKERLVAPDRPPTAAPNWLRLKGGLTTGAGVK